ncbi:ribosomal RNA small subunit methyltransferase A [Candidatus Uhrbacteria bacterium]|nr:ribosomal RNA small subunit methyltransferase A [Candidatus Uhrbacteria bacterium]
MPTPMQFLRESGVRPLHRRGQNFLIDTNIIRKIVEAAGIKKTDTIVEIGSGSGELTAELAVRAKKVVAVEIDAHLFWILDSRFRGNDKGGDENDNITLLKDDIRAIPNTIFGKKDGAYRVIANIPYHITSQIIRKFLENTPRPKELILLMQKEVAQRIAASPPQMSLLAVSVQYYAEARILFPVSRNSFFPKPNVDSAVVRLVVKDSKQYKNCHPRSPIKLRTGSDRGSRAIRKTSNTGFPLDGGNDRGGNESDMQKFKDVDKERRDSSLTVRNDKFFFSIVRAGFSAKRKQCAQSISKKLRIPLTDVLSAFQKADVQEKARAQEISVSQWREVTKLLLSSQTVFRE